MNKHGGKPTQGSVTLEDLARMLQGLGDTLDRMIATTDQILDQTGNPKKTLCGAIDDLAKSTREPRDSVNGTSSKNVRHYGSSPNGFSSVSASRGNLRHMYQA